jgi:hypothetical protein
MTKVEIKNQVGTLVTKGESTQSIANKLGLTNNQVTHIRSYYFGKSKTTVSPQKQAWVTRRANAKAIVKADVKAKAKVSIVESNKPRIIEINGIEIEIHHSIVKRVIITQEGAIKIK